MSSIQRHLIVKAIFLLSKIGAHRASLACTDKLLQLNVSLSQLRQAVSAAHARDDHETALRFTTYAIEKFPANTFGYLEKAKILAARGNTAEAVEVLSTAPNCGPVSDALRSYQTSSKPAVKAKKAVKKPQALVSSNDLEQSLLMAGNDASWLGIIAEQAEYAIKADPSNPTNFNILARTYHQLNQHDKLIQAITSFPDSISCSLNYQLMLAKAYQSSRNQLAAFDALIAAQVEHPAERKLLMRISDMLRDDAQIARAYSYLCASQALYPSYGSVKRLSFEIDNALFEHARETLLSILQFPQEALMKFMPMINRATPFFPELTNETQAARANARELLSAEKGRKGINPDDQIKVAVKCRWINEAYDIVKRNRGGKQPVSSENLAWLNTVAAQIDRIRPLVEMATTNEISPHLYGLKNGSIVDIDPNTINPLKTVEVFIPTVFFAAPNEEKPSYATVREFLGNVYDYLMSRTDLTLVPRHQWNWRNCDPRTPNARVVSYHTNAPYNTNHLHIQEVPLAGRCSMDHQGFAGYASLATVHTPIEEASAHISEAMLAENEKSLHQTYVQNNISKYSQTVDRVSYDDDYVFVALQIPTDTVAALAYVTGAELVKTVAEHYLGSTTKVRVKRHPYCNSMTVQKTLDTLLKAEAIEISDASVHDLISGAKAVFTVNSGVGLEALLHSRPVIVTGDCDYAYATSAQPKSIDELKTILNNDFSFDHARTRQLLHYYVNGYSMASNDAKAIHERLRSWLM
ncbi:capsule polysaccharide export protein [Pseudomonas sp. GM84]|uniref:capsular polysaccharide export protein, LipB/KpsS family n=1 Tax=Pseudomonas sp. GM84 TaxID=1144340 RepID=UPI00026F5E87|nr:capsule polysaccharide export protein [Pseudomonas sp. GM84]EJN40119.1 capsule polysaccharide export protein [Pseudomonas sp. GM84]